MIYTEHIFNKQKEIINEINNSDKSNIKKKLSEYTYLCNFLKAFAIKNNSKCSSSAELLSLFIEEYGNISINYETIADDIKNKKLENYKKKKNLDNVDIKDIINLNII